MVVPKEMVCGSIAVISLRESSLEASDSATPCIYMVCGMSQPVNLVMRYAMSYFHLYVFIIS